MQQKQTIVILTAGGLNPAVTINALSQRFDDLHVIFEQPESKLQILKRRSRLCGPISALGQLATMIASRLGKGLAQRRIKELLNDYQLDGTVPAKVMTYSVETLNSDACVKLIEDIAPTGILSVSCRVIKKQYLAKIPCPVINLHAGINPRYRGQMGGYWARIAGDEANFGATVHLVDSGIDTGATLYEARVKPSRKDTLSTYPLLITAAAIPSVILAFEDLFTGSLSPKRPKEPASKLLYPPTIWTWAWHGLTKGIW